MCIFFQEKKNVHIFSAKRFSLVEFLEESCSIELLWTAISFFILNMQNCCVSIFIEKSIANGSRLHNESYSAIDRRHLTFLISCKETYQLKN
jgi:hypothetical protein